MKMKRLLVFGLAVMFMFCAGNAFAWPSSEASIDPDTKREYQGSHDMDWTLGGFTEGGIEASGNADMWDVEGEICGYGTIDLDGTITGIALAGTKSYDILYAIPNGWNHYIGTFSKGQAGASADLLVGVNGYGFYGYAEGDFSGSASLDMGGESRMSTAPWFDTDGLATVHSGFDASGSFKIDGNAEASFFLFGGGQAEAGANLSLYGWHDNWAGRSIEYLTPDITRESLYADVNMGVDIISSQYDISDSNCIGWASVDVDGKWQVSGGANLNVDQFGNGAYAGAAAEGSFRNATRCNLGADYSATLYGGVNTSITTYDGFMQGTASSSAAHMHVTTSPNPLQ